MSRKALKAAKKQAERERERYRQCLQFAEEHELPRFTNAFGKNTPIWYSNQFRRSLYRLQEKKVKEGILKAIRILAELGHAKSNKILRHRLFPRCRRGVPKGCYIAKSMDGPYRIAWVYTRGDVGRLILIAVGHHTLFWDSER